MSPTQDLALNATAVFHLFAGSTGGELEPMPDLPASVIATGEIWQRGRYWIHRPEARLTAGIWESGVFRTRPFRFGGDEFFTILEGEIRFEMEGRDPIVVGAGQSALVPLGADIVWEQRVPVRKLFMRADPAA